MEPEYACALIRAPKEGLWLQLRPHEAPHAADSLTCFGGRREPDEDDVECLLRELHEELAWTPSWFAPACELWRGNRFIARFFDTGTAQSLKAREPGQVAVAAPLATLAGLPLTPWHAQVIAAWRAGKPRVDLGDERRIAKA